MSPYRAAAGKAEPEPPPKSARPVTDAIIALSNAVGDAEWCGETSVNISHGAFESLIRELESPMMAVHNGFKPYPHIELHTATGTVRVHRSQRT